MQLRLTSIVRQETCPPLMEELEGRQLYSAASPHQASLTPAHRLARKPRHDHGLVVSFHPQPHHRPRVVNPDFGGFYGIFSNTDFGGFRGIATGRITASQAFAPPFRGIGLTGLVRPFSLSSISRI